MRAVSLQAIMFLDTVSAWMEVAMNHAMKIFCTEINNYCWCNMNCNFCREERERWKPPKTAEGERLDIMAELVGTTRNGRTDEELREAIVNELDKVNKRKE